MLSRYILEKDLSKEYFKNVCEDLIKKYNESELEEISFGEIEPGDKVVALTKAGPMILKWGYPRVKGNGLIINTPHNSVHSGKFAVDVVDRRCVVLARGFYLFNDGKYLVRNNENYMFFVGCYNEDGECVIFDKDASRKLVDFTYKMPVMVKSNDVDKWLCGENIVVENEYVEVLKVQQID